MVSSNRSEESNLPADPQEMNWIKENKFLAVFIAVVVLLSGAGIYLLLGAKGNYDDTIANYQQTATELTRLQQLPLFPNEANLKKLEEQRTAHLEQINSLHNTLLSMQAPVVPMTPEQFQDKLRASVTEFTQKAADAGMKLPDHFFMGFDRYQSEPPRPAAAPLLGRELAAVQFVLSELPQHSVLELRSLVREELPEERDTKPEPVRSPGPRQQADANPLLTKHALQLEVLAPKGSFQLVLNDVVKSRAALHYSKRSGYQKREGQRAVEDRRRRSSTDACSLSGVWATREPGCP